MEKARRSPLDLFAQLADRIDAAREELTTILSEIESHETSADEIWKSADALRNAHLEARYFTRQLRTGASFLPLNLPLYSLVLFAVIPSAVVETIHVRAPARLASVLARICDVLQIGAAVPGVCVSYADRDTFVREHAATADVVVFTGKLANAQKLRPLLRRDVLFLFSGRGVNPVVIAADADIETAIAKTADVKLFNSGQDCAAPDCIFVHRSRSAELIEGLGATLSRVGVGRYDDPDVRVGPLVEREQLAVAAKHLAEHRESIVFGGRVDFLEGIVHPSVVFHPRFDKTNAAELFAPVFFITEYESDEQLASYFESAQYRQNAMYVSLFGSSEYLESQRHTIVLRDTIINDVERGNLEYGGHSLGASFVQVGKDVKAQPILVSREVSAHIAWRERLASARDVPGCVTMEVHEGFEVFRACGPLPGRRLVVVGSVDAESSGVYACHRLLHELRSRRIRVDVGELTFVIPRAGRISAHRSSAALAALVRDVDQTLVLRAYPMEPSAFVVGDFARPWPDDLAESLGIGEIVFDPLAPRSAGGELIVQCGDDTDPATSNVAFDVVMNAARHLQIIGGGARPAGAVQRRVAEIPFLAMRRFAGDASLAS